MDNREMQNRTEPEKNKKNVWKTIGIIGLAVFLAVLTVLLINL